MIIESGMETGMQERWTSWSRSRARSAESAQGVQHLAGGRDESDGSNRRVGRDRSVHRVAERAMKPPTIPPYATWATSTTTGVRLP
jgi:hypothetical protein